MSINAISSVSLYEYYYSINRDDKKKKSSPIAKEMQEYGLKPTDDEQLNVAMLQMAKNVRGKDDSEEDEKESYSKRPWADLMYQLGLSFNPNPKDDIQDIKDELNKLVKGVSDNELEKEVKDLVAYVENLYISYNNNNLSGSIGSFDLLGSQLNNLSMMNRVNLM